MKRVFSIHGWEGTPTTDWHPWLKKELETRGYEVIVPVMPDTNTPKIEKWVPHLKKIVGQIDSNTYFVCHSIACQTLLRFLETVPGDTKIGGSLFVAPWLNLNNLEDEESEIIAKPWLDRPINWIKVKPHLSKLLCLFSTDDPYVPPSDAGLFKLHLNCQTQVIKNQGHFTNIKLPINIDKIVEVLS